MADLKEIQRAIKENDIKQIRFLFVDNDGIIRARSSSSGSLENDIVSGHSYNILTPMLGNLDLINPYSRFGSVGEMRAVPDVNTFKIAPYTKQTATMICDATTAEYEDWELCGRTTLKRLIKESGFDVMASFENEYYLIREKEDGKLEPFDSSYFNSSIGMHNVNDILLDTVNSLEDQGISVERYYCEYGPGQQEIAIKYSDALSACDNQIIFRETARSVARNHGLLATFLPKPFNGRPASGLHIHISLWKDGKNIFYDSNEKNTLSQTARYFIGGILKYTQALCLFSAPIVNSYKRFIPGHWTSAYTFYGIDNREAAVRVCSSRKGIEADSLNIEFKAADSTCNPYIALAALIAAGMEGIKSKFDPGAPLQVDPIILSSEEREKRGIYRYPTTLQEAIAYTEKAAFFRDVFGEVFMDEYINQKKYVWEQYSNWVSDWEVNHYANVF